MAKAPAVKKGGYDAAAKRAQRAQETYRVSVLDADPEFSFEFQPHNIPARVRSKVRDETGKTVEVLLFGVEGFDVTTYALMWWVRRLIDGELVRRETVLDEWDEKFPGLTREDIIDEKVEAPEA